MLDRLAQLLLIFCLFLLATADDLGYPRCNCDVDGFWTAETILHFQKVSDFLIAAAYFSIPIELLCFATCATLLPFKWIFLQFGAFIVLCGLTHFLNAYTYEPHSFFLMLSLTISKFFTALVSFITAITFLTLIPQLLRIKVREEFLLTKAQELDREVGKMKRQEETSWHVRMLTQEIRKSLDRHTILYTTLVELSNTLGLQNSAVWMPDEKKKVMNLTHELRQRSSIDLYSVPIDDPAVLKITETKGVNLLSQNSCLSSASSGMVEPGAVAAIRLPMLKVCNFKGGTPEFVRTSYGILVLVLPGDCSRTWSHQDMEIIEVVADQVAVALSHAAVLEESQLMREKLVDQNQALLQAKKSAMMASEARNKFQVAISQGIRGPVHSILGLLSMMQQANLSQDQRLIIDTMIKSTGVVSTLVNDSMEMSTTNSERVSLVMKPFNLHSTIKEAVSAARCLCESRGLGFTFHVEQPVPSTVVGDEKRIFHVLLHMVGTALSRCNEGNLTFQVLCYNEDSDKNKDDQGWVPWKSSFSDGHTCVKFEIGTKRAHKNISSLSPQISQGPISESLETGLSFRLCKRLVQMMQGNIWALSNLRNNEEIIMLVLQLQLQPRASLSDTIGSSELLPVSSVANFKGLRVLLVDDDDTNRAVTSKLLEKLGCQVTSVTSGLHCLTSFAAPGTSYQIVILDLHMPQMDGFEVAVRIRKFTSGSWPVIVALTASSEDNVRERCLKSGMNGLIRKPVTLQAMGDELYGVLQNT